MAAPTDILVTGGNIREGAPAGALIAELAAVDSDIPSGDVFTFEITADPSGFFEIVGNEIRLLAGANLDFETQQQHVITVQGQRSDDIERSRRRLCVCLLRDIEQHD